MNIEEVKANPRGYWLGPVQNITSLGEYTFVEYQRQSETFFSIFIDGKAIGLGANSLDSAMVTAIAHKHDGPNSQAAQFFMRMIGAEKEE